MGARALALAAAAAALPLLVVSHGSLIIPPPRNAVDSTLAPWNGTVPVRSDGVVAFDPWCPVPSADAPATAGMKLSGKNGQACFWFNSGCSIGCKTCDGTTRGPIPNINCTRPGDNLEMCRRKMAVCATGLKQPTLPREARTVNTDKAAGADDDWYQFSPWRAPGSAGITDPCGVAGGVKSSLDRNGEYGVSYRNTTHARWGRLGSSLPRRETGTVWTAGEVVEVSWSLNANHGGGYYYRLCKLPEDGSPVTEACFQQTPLEYVGNTRFRWNADPSTEEEIDTVLVSQGTTPPGSTWAMNPIPRNDTEQTGASFAPKCNETCSGCSGGFGGACSGCRCTGEWGPVNLEIVDRVALPWMLPAGDYVLGWRWDTEESNQVWGQCADVTIKANAGAASLGSWEGVPCPLKRGLCVADVAQPRKALAGKAGPGKDLPFNETIGYVRDLLQQAIMVEHGTIPLYLTSLWSIGNGSSPDAMATIHSVVIEEMLHMSIAANVLNAIGGTPMMDAPGFIPQFPLNLPLTNVSVSIKPFDRASVANFMLIESTTHTAKSIGAAYEYVLSVLEELCREYGEAAVFSGDPAYQVEVYAPSLHQSALPITTLDEAAEAVLGVSDQGGGCPVPGEEALWPTVANISAGPLGGVLSHYARFAEIGAERRYRFNDTVKGGPTGERVDVNWTHVYNFRSNPQLADLPVGSHAYNVSKAFASKYTQCLTQLHNVFNGAPETYSTTLAAMHDLTRFMGVLLETPDPLDNVWRPGPLKQHVLGPPWEYVPEASEFAARGGRARPIARTARAPSSSAGMRRAIPSTAKPMAGIV